MYYLSWTIITNDAINYRRKQTVRVQKKGLQKATAKNLRRNQFGVNRAVMQTPSTINIIDNYETDAANNNQCRCRQYNQIVVKISG